jgi:triacylglycerol lipase
VLAHGVFGLESYGVVDYWNGIVAELQAAGHAVFVTQVSPANSTTLRGEQLLDQVQTLLAATGKQKVNLICHSQGGLDCRYVAGVAPDLVASVTTLSTPHRGSPVAELLEAGIDAAGAPSPQLVALLGDAIDDLLELITGTSLPSDARAAIASLTPAALDAFNAVFPDGLPDGCGSGPPLETGIRFFSWTGDQVLTHALDPLDPAFAKSSLAFWFEENDGLVGVCSAHFGEVIRDDYAMNHIDVVNLMFGLVHPLEVNPVTVILQHAQRLRNLGL